MVFKMLWKLFDGSDAETDNCWEVELGYHFKYKLCGVLIIHRKVTW
jgi:hypothetical protein